MKASQLEYKPWLLPVKAKGSGGKYNGMIWYKWNDRIVSKILEYLAKSFQNYRWLNKFIA